MCDRKDFLTICVGEQNEFARFSDEDGLFTILLLIDVEAGFRTSFETFIWLDGLLVNDDDPVKSIKLF